MRSNAFHISPTARGSAARGGALARLGRRLLLARLMQLRAGELILREGPSECHFGERAAGFAEPVVVEILDTNFYAAAAFGGSVGAGSAYMEDYWRCADLTTLLRLFVRNREVLQGLDGLWSALSRPLLWICHALNANTRRGSARNIAAHYDLGNRLYGLMLDESMAYSCGIFASPTSTLHEAQLAKFDVVCRKLALKREDHLLEIGTGWGGLAIHAARHYGCRVTTTTISEEQYEFARARVAEAGLSASVTLLKRDYRDLQGVFDKLVSIEMIEAVGADFLDTYAATCARLLKPDGLMLLQAITIRDQLYEQALRSVDFIQRFIFPGSFIPSIQAISAAFARCTQLKIVHLEDIGRHYARTLREWRMRVFGSLAELRRLGYDARFVRMWQFYLCYCEAGYLEGQLGNVQVLFSAPGRNISLKRSIHAY